MYSFTTSGGNVIVENISNPNQFGQFNVATVVSTSSDVTWSYTLQEDKVKFFVLGVELTPAKFATIRINGVYCTSKSDFVSKITACLPYSYHLNSGSGGYLSQVVEASNNLETKTFLFADSAATKSFTIAAGYVIRSITFESAVTQNVRIGNTPNGEELMSDTEVVEDVALDVTISIPSTRAATRTIYINSSAGDIIATILYVKFFKS